MHILIWALALLALGLWTLLAWATAWLLGLDPALMDGWAGHLGDMPGAAWLDLWLPGWDAALAAVLSLTRELFAALGGIGVWLVWGAWAVGALLVVGTAALASGVVGVARRALGPKAATAGPAGGSASGSPSGA